MNSRKNDILAAVIEEYNKTAEPVGSAVLSRNYHFKVSPATLRNEMTGLERQGLLSQPHTSAGRIPTEKGYRYYIENVAMKAGLGERENNFLRQFISGLDLRQPESFKILAKVLAEAAKVAIIIGWKRRDVYCTGLSQFFSQPELHDPETLARLAGAIDRIDEVMDAVSDKMKNNLEVWIGEENPFAPLCGTVMSRLKSPIGENTLFGFLGPMRMNYSQNIALIKSVSFLITTGYERERE